MRLLHHPDDIERWLNKYCEIGDYTLTPHDKYRFVVNVSGNVRVRAPMAVKFGHVSGSFSCKSLGLSSLLGAPDSVEDYFDSSHNNLQSLEHGPQSVGSFDCSHNQLKSLEFLAGNIGASLYCGYNYLSSLEHVKSVGNTIDCQHNAITTLVGCPEELVSMDCSYNDLEHLDFMPDITFPFFCFYEDKAFRPFNIEHNPKLGAAQDILDLQQLKIAAEKHRLELDIRTLKVHGVHKL